MQLYRVLTALSRFSLKTESHHNSSLETTKQLLVAPSLVREMQVTSLEYPGSPKCGEPKRKHEC